MEQPPTSSLTGSEPDLPKPPIWDRSAPAATPPVDIPRLDIPRVDVPLSATPALDPPAEALTYLAPVESEITQNVLQTPTQSNPSASVGPPGPAASQIPAVAPTAVVESGPLFADRSFVTAPASGAGVSGGPLWPAEPPTIGLPISPTSPPAHKARLRVAMMTLAVMLIVAVAVAGFFFGRSVVSSELATTPIAAAPTSEAPTTTVEAASPPATSVAVPAVPPVNDIALPVLPGEDAEEPVAAVARAVAPAVVLIQNELGQGSGIIYDAEGLILTNAHVVGQFTKVQVTLASGVRVPGEVLGADPLTDVAVVRIDTDFEFGVAVLAPESSVEVGQLAVAIGSPFGLQQTVTSGIVSAKGRVLENLIEDGRLSVVSMIQTDASINPGNSGGALADRQGRVIGMNTSIRTDGSGGNIGVGFAVPSDTAKLIADRIIAGQPLEQGFLGINGGTPAIGEPGVVVGEVTVGSGADIAGLLSGDLIVGFNGDRIKSMSDLAAAVRLQSPEATVTVEFVREGQNMLVEVTLGLLNGQ